MCSKRLEREARIGDCNTNMADTTLLCNAIENANCRPNFSITTEEPSSVTQGGMTPSDNQWNTTTSGLENFRRNK